MKLTFFGAAKAVTGSCHCVESGGRKVLIDCGLQQGRDERDNRELDFNAGYIDDVIEPRNTRFRVIRALAQLKTKSLTNPAKKHGNIPL